MILIVSDGLNGYSLLGLTKLEIDVKFLGLEETSITSCPPLKRFFNYQLNLMSFVKIHPRHTSEIQCPVLCPRILHRHTYAVSRHNVSTPVFQSTAVEHSQTFFLQASTLRFLLFFFEKGVGSIMTKWMKPQEHKKQILTFLHTVLPTWEQTAKSSKCPTAPSMNYRIR